MDSLQCPGCGAAVRPKESWCSLCYRNLRPQEPLVVAGQAGAGMISANLLEPAAKPINIAGIPHPSSPSSTESLSEDEDPDEVGEPSKVWPCTCGADVPFDIEGCPDCGRAFLGELRGVDAAPLGGPAWLAPYLAASRNMRLAIAGMFALVVGVGIPLLLTLLT